ncbi:hypothetical protein TNCV_3418051 [Trichonephila clavipes]|nr:hypothetical protein TNCV_3418051 [Trichonephila clavipes]
MADKDIFEFVRSSKIIIDTIDSDGENEMNYAAPVSMSSGMRNIKNSTRSYSDIRSNDEMSNKIDDIDHRHLDAKKDNATKNIRLFSRN